MLKSDVVICNHYNHIIVNTSHAFTNANIIHSRVSAHSRLCVLTATHLRPQGRYDGRPGAFYQATCSKHARLSLTDSPLSVNCILVHSDCSLYYQFFSPMTSISAGTSTARTRKVSTRLTPTNCVDHYVRGCVSLI